VILLFDIGQNDLSALLVKRFSKRSPDTLSGSGDQCYFPFESLHNGFSIVFGFMNRA
jgi:hypothetical protein